MMKRILTLVLAMAMLTLVLVGCAPTDQFNGRWTFSKISSVELSPEVPEETLDAMKEYYNVEDAEGVVAAAHAAFAADGTFDPCYINFAGKNTYAYDPLLEREATWCFYKTGENEGFLSFYAELDASEGNIDPYNWPNVVYKAETNTMEITLHHSGFMVTVELTK